MVITGTYAVLRVGFRWAADLHKWNLTRSVESLNAATISVSGKLGPVDRYWVLRTPLTLGLSMDPDSWWVWPVIGAIGGSTGDVIAFEVSGDPEAATQFSCTGRSGAWQGTGLSPLRI